MNWKEFFKPNKIKIILTIIFIIVFLFLPMIPYSIQPHCELGAPCPKITEIMPVFVYMVNEYNLVNSRTQIPNIYFFILLIAIVFISYLISCIVYSFYYKISKR